MFSTENEPQLVHVEALGDHSVLVHLFKQHRRRPYLTLMARRSQWRILAFIERSFD